MRLRSWASIVVTAIAVACSAVPVPSEQPTPEPRGSTFTGDEISFDYPASWNAVTFDVVPSTNFNWLVFLTTGQLRNPCVRDGNRTSCSGYPIDDLGENGVLINWSHWGFVGWELDLSVGPLVDVGGRRATVDARLTNPNCSRIGGAEEIVVQVELPNAPFNWHEMRACFAGPDVETTRAEIDAMLQSVVWKR
jgi:hypothetical protein